MSMKKPFWKFLAEKLFGRLNLKAAHSKKRSLQMESLEVREMLSAVGFHSTVDATEDGQAGYFRLERDDTQGNLTVAYNIDWRNTGSGCSFGWAMNGRDFDLLPGSYEWDDYGYAAFEDGKKYLDIPIIAHTDGLIEGDEIVKMSLPDWGYGYSFLPGSQTAELTIHYADVPVNVWIHSTQNAAEGGQNGYVRLQRDVTTVATSVAYDISSANGYYESLVDGKAKNGIDFNFLPGTNQSNNHGSVTFGIGEEYVDIPIAAINDSFVEGNETLDINLYQQVSYISGVIPAVTIQGTKSASVSIIDDEIQQSVGIATTYDAAEGGDNGYFRLQRTNADSELTVYFSFDSRNVDYYFHRGWGKYGTDFSWLPGMYEYENIGSITFAAGEFFADIPINVTNDLYVEGEETVTLTLQPGTIRGGNGSFYLLDSEHQTASITIYDNDAPVNVWIGEAVNATEGGQNGYFRVYRDNTVQPLTVFYDLDYRNSDSYSNYPGWAKIGRDFSYLPGSSGRIDFAVGQEYVDIPINVIDDDFYEETEFVRIVLLNSNGYNDYYDEYYSPGLTYTLDPARREATLSIIDDEPRVNVWIEGTKNATEGGQNGLIQIWRDNDSSELEVYFRLDERNIGNPNTLGWAKNGIDFTLLPGTSQWGNKGYVKFEAGQKQIH